MTKALQKGRSRLQKNVHTRLLVPAGVANMHTEPPKFRKAGRMSEIEIA